MGARDALPERLELKPTCQMRSDQHISILGGFVRNSLRLARGLGKKLRLAGTIHGNKPPSGFVNGVAHSEQAVIPQDGGLFRAKSASDAVAFSRIFNDAGVIVEDRVILIKRAGVLRKWVQT